MSPRSRSLRRLLKSGSMPLAALTACKGQTHPWSYMCAVIGYRWSSTEYIGMCQASIGGVWCEAACDTAFLHHARVGLSCERDT